MGPALRRARWQWPWTTGANRRVPNYRLRPTRTTIRFSHPPNAAAPTGILFDSKTFTVMAIAQPADSEMPDLNVDKDGDRVLIVIDGDLSLQIGENRFRLGPGDAVQIPRGARFGKSRSSTGAHLLLIRGKGMRSFSMYR